MALNLTVKDLVPIARYSKDHNNRTTHQILPHTNSYFHCLYSYLDLLPQGPLGTPGRQSTPGTLGATEEGLDSCKDNESSY